MRENLFLTKADPYYIIRVNSYKRKIEVLLRLLQMKGVQVQILREISLEKICRYPDGSRRIQPSILQVSKLELSTTDVINVVEMHKLTYDFDALLQLVCDLAEADHNFNYVAPLRCYFVNSNKTEEPSEGFQWIFCLIRKIAKKVFFNINGLTDIIDPSPKVAGSDWKIIGFNHL